MGDSIIKKEEEGENKVPRKRGRPRKIPLNTDINQQGTTHSQENIKKENAACSTPLSRRRIMRDCPKCKTKAAWKESSSSFYCKLCLDSFSYTPKAIDETNTTQNQHNEDDSDEQDDKTNDNNKRKSSDDTTENGESVSRLSWSSRRKYKKVSPTPTPVATPADHSDSTEPTVDCPAHSPEPIEPTQPIVPTDTNPTTPTNNTDITTNPTDSTDSTDPTDPTDTDHSDHIDSTNHIDHTNSSNPTDHTDPTTPIIPTTPPTEIPAEQEIPTTENDTKQNSYKNDEDSDTEEEDPFEAPAFSYMDSHENWQKLNDENLQGSGIPITAE